MPPNVAGILGFNSGNRSGVQRTNVVGGGQRTLDRHQLEHVKVGTARAHHISFLVAEFGPQFRFSILLGLSFLSKFMVTVNFDENLVLFRSRMANR